MVASLGAGVYTAVVSGVGGTTGIGMVETYDADSSNPNHLVAVSARAYVGTGDNVTIAGFVISGPGNKTVLIRGLGPQLYNQVSGALLDPQLALYQGGTQLRYNDYWQLDENGEFVGTRIAAVAASVGAQELTSGSADAALLVSLPAGIYTAILSGVGGGTGIGMIEIYEVN